MKNAINWFEIPVTDFAKQVLAKPTEYYLLNYKLRRAGYNFRKAEIDDDLKFLKTKLQ